MKEDKPGSTTWKRQSIRMLAFPASVLAIYGIFFAIVPDKVSSALTSSGNILLSILPPLAFVFILMLLLNLFMKPGQIIKFLGKKAGIKGIVLSTLSGIISTGPIYAWYPLLKELREKGAGYKFIAIFLGNRAVKPFLLPIMISYFGCVYVLILTVLTIFGSLVVGYSVGALTEEKN